MIKRSSWWGIGGGLVLLLIVCVWFRDRVIVPPLLPSESSFGMMGEGVAAPAGIATKGMDSAMDRAIAMPNTAAPGGALPPDAIVTSNPEHLIVRNGTITMVVDDVSDAIRQIKEYVEGQRGFVVNSQVTKHDVSPTGSITVRIPVDTFSDGFDMIKTFGSVEDEFIDGQDITEQYVDVEARLKNLYVTEDQFVEIMDAAVKIEDVLAVQRELTYVRQQIEQLEAQAKYLRDTAAMSTITVYLSTDPSGLPFLEDGEKWRPLGVFKTAARSLVLLGQGLVNGLIWVVVYLPVAAILLILGWVIRRYLVKRKQS